MHIEKNRVVRLDYTLRDEQGTVLDSSSGRGSLSYLHGKGNIIPGLEQALAEQVPGWGDEGGEAAEGRPVEGPVPRRRIGRNGRCGLGGERHLPPRHLGAGLVPQRDKPDG